ncbi:MAG TPA: hypothetical protein PLV68_10615, partial [Ilumatobacteraceae bacterium]|nr:hypothetical protein [Ilumatobacteraceae bacterium]
MEEKDAAWIDRIQTANGLDDRLDADRRKEWTTEASRPFELCDRVVSQSVLIDGRALVVRKP